MELWELIAREQVRDTYARYNHAGDALRLETLAGCFCDDGQLEVRGREPAVGREAIVRFLRDGTTADRAPTGERRLVRHSVANIWFESVKPDEIRSSAYFTIVTDQGLDAVGRYRDELVPDGHTWHFRRRFVSVDWTAASGLRTP